MRIIVYGDSIAEGMWDYKDGGWVHKLKLEYWKKYKYDKILFNYAVSAYTTEHILNQFQSSFNTVCRREEGKESEAKIIIAVGINDSSQDIYDGKNIIPLDKFTENIEILISLCQKEKLIHNVVFISAINIDEDETNRDTSRWGNRAYYNETIQKYNKQIKSLAEKTTCGYIDIFGIMKPDDFEDGLHPNTQGHEKMYQTISKQLQKKL